MLLIELQLKYLCATPHLEQFQNYITIKQME